MKVKFLEAREVLDGNGVVIQKFRAGQVVELSAASARHWINRSAAEIVGSGTVPSVGPRGPQSKSEEGRFGGDAAKQKVTPTPDTVDPMSPKRGRGRPRSVSRPDQA